MIRLALLCMTALACAAGAQTWEQLPPIPKPLGVAAPFAGVSGGALLVAGGEVRPGVRSPEVWSFSK